MLLLHSRVCFIHPWYRKKYFYVNAPQALYQYLSDISTGGHINYISGWNLDVNPGGEGVTDFISHMHKHFAGNAHP